MRSPLMAKTRRERNPLHKQQRRGPRGTALAQQSSVSGRQKCEYEMFPCELTPFMNKRRRDTLSISLRPFQHHPCVRPHGWVPLVADGTNSRLHAHRLPTWALSPSKSTTL